MDSDGTNQRHVASHIVAKSTRGWSPDSKRIVFAAAADNNVDIYTVDVPSGKVARLTLSSGEDRDPSWSPDGTHLAFSSTRDGTPQIYVMSADGRDLRRLTNDTSSGVAPRWSPDGKAIAFVSDRDRTRDLYVIGADGQGLEGLTVGARMTRDPPLWSPDGSRIAFQIAGGANYDIGVVRVSDGLRSLLASSPAYDGSYTWSPDGKRLAFISGRDGFDSIYIVEADGQHPVRLTGTASLTPAWGSQR
jgi:Tol biopolymer transport system component